MSQFHFGINTHSFWERNLEVIGETSRKGSNRNLCRLLNTFVLVSNDSALVTASFGVVYPKIKI